MSKNKSEIEKNREYFINRELSWLDFNMRVLTQGDAPEVPLLEKLRFCAIYTICIRITHFKATAFVSSAAKLVFVRSCCHCEPVHALVRYDSVFHGNDR